jgi:2-polyprenyl-6-methoxyphenol hydroxylase-like FAD-dependent oxidoreductase
MMTLPIKNEYDVVVVGARVAGAAVAMLLAQRGLSVLCVDKGVAGSDTLSTHALMRGGVLQLARWGLLDELRSQGTPDVETTTFHYGSETIRLAIPERQGVRALMAPRRYLLDAVLVEAARRAGAEVRHGVRLEELSYAPDGAVNGVFLHTRQGPRRVGADLVIGADGGRSKVAALVGARTIHRGRHASASIYAYVEGLPDDGYHWYYNHGGAAGAIPTNGGHCVFAGLPPARYQAESRDVERCFQQVLREVSPELADGVAQARRTEPFRRFPGVAGYLRQAWGPGWALVGDAGYFKDPLTAHGMTDALRDAELLARAAAVGTRSALAQYQTARDRLSAQLFRITDEVASLTWSLEALQALHLALSESMKAEEQVLAGLGGAFQSAA